MGKEDREYGQGPRVRVYSFLGALSRGKGTDTTGWSTAVREY